MSKHTETVSKIYEAFGQGDIPSILSYLDDNVQWEAWENNFGQDAGIPWLPARKGKEGAMEFFKVVGAMKFNEFNVISIMEGPNQVAVELVIEAEIPQSGATLRDEEIHLWTFNDAGKVERMRHYVDSTKHIQVAQTTDVMG